MHGFTISPHFFDAPQAVRSGLVGGGEVGYKWGDFYVTSCIARDPKGISCPNRGGKKGILFDAVFFGAHWFDAVFFGAHFEWRGVIQLPFFLTPPSSGSRPSSCCAVGSQSIA